MTLTVHKRTLQGVGCSPGTATGTARVIRSVDDWTRVRAGDIVVSPAMTADRTPLFSIINGWVSDHGGVLSNAAIVARERKLPVVVGTQIGTKIIRDGQRITVDGAAGCVRVGDA